MDRFFNTNLDTVKEENPEWLVDPKKGSEKFYKKYQVTKEQNKEFDEYFYKQIPKKLGLSQKYWKRASSFKYLDVAPSVKID